MGKVPIGIQNFREIRDRGGYYIDKTSLIDEILNNDLTMVHLFTRPRRFGKSTNLSMIDAYLNLRYIGNNWFEGLGISDLRPSDPLKNTYPVIYLDLKESASDSYDTFLEKFRSVIADVCKGFPELAEPGCQDPDDVSIFMDLKAQRSNLGNLIRSASILSRMLEKRFLKKAVILIDEYDGPLNQTYGQPEQARVMGFLREFLSSALKGNDHLAFAVVTGVMQVAKESIFSGLNNLKVNSILSTDMDEMFGFTPDEVERMCADFGHAEAFGMAREWYDGYRFGDAEIYNPWSVLMFVDSGFVPAPYWAGTSGNSIIADLLSIPDEETYRNIMLLGSGKSIPCDIKPGVTFADMSDLGKGIYTVMAFSGYLTAVHDDASDAYTLHIPNREMYGIFADTIVDRTGHSGLTGPMRQFSKAVLSGDTERIRSSLLDLLERVVSGRVLDNEHSYQAFIAGLLMNLFGNYRITADFESGLGCHDIRMERIRGSTPNIVMEIKKSKLKDPSGEQMSSLALEALNQIHRMDYAHGLAGETLLYGIAFHGKVPTVVSERLAQGSR